MMNLDQLFILAERLRKEAIGEPEWIAEKRVYEYNEHSARVVAVLKIMRAAQGVAALNQLCRSGLFIDFGVIIRCVNDCVGEVYFLLEEFPKTSSHVDQFVKGFFESTIDGYLSKKTPQVQTAKIRSARVRYLKGHADDRTLRLMERIYQTFSGYVHANYAHIMEIYGGPAHDFNLAGVPSPEERQKRIEYVELETDAVLHAAWFVAHTLGLKELRRDIAQNWQ